MNLLNCQEIPEHCEHEYIVNSGQSILRLYVSTEKPSKTIGYLVEVVINMYVPTRFDIIKIDWRV